MARLKSDIVDQIYNYVLDKINNREYSSGDIVSEVALSQELNISRTPVREALMRLIDVGVLERTKTKVVVKAITFDDIKEILQVREAIELMSIRIIIENGGLTKTQLKEISDINLQLINSIEKGETEQNFKCDFKFHELLVNYSGNKRLVDICARINIQSQRFRWLTLLTPARYFETKNEHIAILNALKNNDKSLASEAVIEHLNNSIQNYEQILIDDKWTKMMLELKDMNIA